jgi:hypothetical protein
MLVLNAEGQDVIYAHISAVVLPCGTLVASRIAVRPELPHPLQSEDSA